MLQDLKKEHQTESKEERKRRWLNKKKQLFLKASLSHVKDKAQFIFYMQQQEIRKVSEHLLKKENNRNQAWKEKLQKEHKERLKKKSQAQ